MATNDLSEFEATGDPLEVERRPRPGVIDAYIRAVMKHAFLEPVDGGAVAATVPQAFGVVALGGTEQDCLDDLRMRLEDWVCASLSKGDELPVIDDIDLGHADRQSLAAYLASRSTPTAGEFFENEQEFEAALARWEKDS